MVPGTPIDLLGGFSVFFVERNTAYPVPSAGVLGWENAAMIGMPRGKNVWCSLANSCKTHVQTHDTHDAADISLLEPVVLPGSGVA